MYLFLGGRGRSGGLVSLRGVVDAMDVTGLRNGVCRVSSLRGPLPLLVGPRCFLGCELRWWSEDEPVCSRVYGVFVRAEYVCARVEKFRECVGVEEVRVHVCGFECGGRVCGLEEVCECRVCEALR